MFDAAAQQAGKKYYLIPCSPQPSFLICERYDTRWPRSATKPGCKAREQQRLPLKARAPDRLERILWKHRPRRTPSSRIIAWPTGVIGGSFQTYRKHPHTAFLSGRGLRLANLLLVR